MGDHPVVARSARAASIIRSIQRWAPSRSPWKNSALPSTRSASPSVGRSRRRRAPRARSRPVDGPTQLASDELSVRRHGEGGRQQRVLLGPGKLDDLFGPAHQLVPHVPERPLPGRHHEPEAEVGVAVGHGGAHGARGGCRSRGRAGPPTAPRRARRGPSSAASASEANVDRWARRTRAASGRLSSCSAPKRRIVSSCRYRTGPVAGVGDHEGLVDERRRAAGGSRPGPGRRRRRSLGGVEVEAAGEHREPAEQQLLGGGEELERPLHQVVEGAVAGVDRRALAQQGEPLVDPVEELVGRQRPHPGGGQLEREWHPVELDAELGDGAGVVLARGRSRRRRSWPGSRRPARRGWLPERLDRRAGIGREPERADTPHDLARHAQGLAAGGQDLEPRGTSAGPRRPGGRRRRARARSCRRRRGCVAGPTAPRSIPRATGPGRRSTARAAATAAATSSVECDRPPAPRPDLVDEVGRRRPPPDSKARRVFPTPPGPTRVSRRGRAERGERGGRRRRRGR